MPAEGKAPEEPPKSTRAVPSLEVQSGSPPQEATPQSQRPGGDEQGQLPPALKGEPPPSSEELRQETSIESLLTAREIEAKELNPIEAASQKTDDAASLTDEQKRQFEAIYKEKYSSADRVDPTQPFVYSSTLRLQFEEAEIGKWTDTLASHRILVLQCYDWQVLRAAADALVAALALPENRQLTFESNIESRSEITFQDISLGKDYGAEALVVAWAHEGIATNFLTTLPTDTTNSRAELEKRRKRILVTVGLPSPQGVGVGPRIYFDVLPYEKALLSTRFRLEKCNELADTIIRLKAQGLWGSDEVSAYQLIYNLLREGDFEAEIRRRSRPSEQQETRLLLGLENGKLLKNTIKFVGAYFTGVTEDGMLSPGEFQRILCQLLENQAIEEETSVAQPGLAPYSVVQKRPLAEEWRLNQQRLISECGLKIQQSLTGPLTVAFEDPDERTLLRQQFQSGFYWTFDDLFQRCLSANLLFDQAGAIRRKTAELVLIKLIANQTGGPVLLSELLRVAVGGDSGTVDSLPVRLASLDQQRMSAVRIGLFEALSLIADANAPSGESFAKLAADNIEKLIEIGCHGLAWYLANRLRNHTIYSKYYLHTLKRLLDESPDVFGDSPETASEGLDALREQTLRKLTTDRPSAPLLAEVLSWSPSHREVPTSRSQNFAFDLALRVSEGAMYHSTPTAVLALFERDSESGDKPQRALLHVLLHPRMSTIIADDCDEERQLAWALSPFLPLSARGLASPPFWPILAATRFLSLAAADDIELAHQFRLLAIIAWVRTAQQARLDPKPLVQRFWQALPRGDRQILRRLLLVVDKTCQYAAKLVGLTVLDRAQRTTSTETLKTLRCATRLIGSSLNTSVN